MNTQNALMTVDKPDEDMQAIAAWLFGKSSHTQRGYSRIAHNLLSNAGKSLRAMTLYDLQAFIASLQGETSSIALATNAIKSLYSFTTELGYTPINIGKVLKSPKVRDELAQRILTEVEAIRMIDRTENKRDHAIIRLLYHAGLRVSEIVALCWQGVRASEQGAVLDVWGKGEKQRYVMISPTMYEELLSLDGRFLGQDRYVFQGRKSKGGTVALDTRQIERLVEDAAIRADVATYIDDKGRKRSHVSPHWLRHSNASHALDNSAPVHVVKESLGHSSLVTTTRYAHIKPGTGSSQYLKV
ncbi:MAG TPA: tyrosine-type recombinase/integrase [Ktedonobacteraceae bacterium]|nr:tyrosine-type recombinase/integrase [Ktedonobacteraceae bacterium]